MKLRPFSAILPVQGTPFLFGVDSHPRTTQCNLYLTMLQRGQLGNTIASCLFMIRQTQEFSVFHSSTIHTIKRAPRSVQACCYLLQTRNIGSSPLCHSHMKEKVNKTCPTLISGNKVVVVQSIGLHLLSFFNGITFLTVFTYRK